MASNSKRSMHDETKFTQAKKNWNLEKLYEDLRAAKQRFGSGKRKVLTETEKCHLRGLLCGCSDKEIANERGVVVGTVSDTLSKTLYRYIEELLDYEEKIRHWSDVRDLLEKAGYKIQASEQSQSSHPLPDKKENILEASHTIGAISFLEYFSKSIDQLESKDLDVRIGAISTLGTVAKYSQPAEHRKIMEYLAAFVRTNTPRKEEEETEERSQKLREDIQAALTVIGRRDPNKDLPNLRLDLSNTDLRGADLREAQLQWANFYQTNLQGTILIEAQLQGADLGKVNLQQANLIEANLQQANLIEANLQGAFLNKTNLQQVDLIGANLKGADLSSAELQRTLLKLANLQSTRLCHAQLQGADIRRSDFSGASLLDANLEGAYIELADFRNAHQLTQEQIDSAKGLARLPDYLKNQRSGSNAN